MAVHLGERVGRVTSAAFLERMKKEGVGTFDEIIRGTKARIRHGEKLVGATLKPTLDFQQSKSGWFSVNNKRRTQLLTMQKWSGITPA